MSPDLSLPYAIGRISCHSDPHRILDLPVTMPLSLSHCVWCPHCPLAVGLRWEPPRRPPPPAAPLHPHQSPAHRRFLARKRPASVAPLPTCRCQPPPLVPPQSKCWGTATASSHL